MTNVLVTGATGAIGQAVCRSFQLEASNIYVHYFRNEQKAKDLCMSMKCDAIPVYADLKKNDGVSTLMDQLPNIPDIVVYCAGTSEPQLIQDVSASQLEETIALHLTSVMKLTQAVLPQMIHHQKGVITLITSIWGLEGASMESVYAAAKSGVHGFLKSIAKEVGRSKVRMNAVAPGAINSEMLSIYSEQERAELADDIPAGRLGRPEEVADAVWFLSQERSSYINGQILSVNGAWHC
ncbi:elongation factor P 5-aminopentanone reductase [Shouchella lehensis]|uniref:Glucose/ribitol dehydrogenase n=1 Tax=Shouchella lehensis G1 TaxID=1246626 RepID=A0A060LX46_9BACI|nr:SDR family oxidoreductase [Shouchella lehensis]AIC94772.1 glucose/ribitol dehydrogenase [Shouchella lehensis G1]